MHCGRCRHPFDVFFFFGSTTLGPDVVYCRLCRSPLASGRREWASFSAFERLRYGLRSLLYSGLVGFCFGYVAFNSYFELWDFHHHDVTAFLHHASFLALTSALAFAVLAFQAWRVLRSRRRTRSSGPHRMAPWLLDVDFAVQLKAALLLGLCFLVATGTGRWLRADRTRGRRVRNNLANVPDASGYRRSPGSSDEIA